MITKGKYYKVNPVPKRLQESYPLKEIKMTSIVKALEDAPGGSLDVVDVMDRAGNLKSVYSFQLEYYEGGWK